MIEIKDICEIQNCLFPLLNYFSDFCKKENLTFFLSNGSLLGAAKYGKFVPWDDDVDILMPREDYEKLISSVDIDTPFYKLLCRSPISKWRMPYAKLIDNRTVLCEQGYDFGEPIGVFLDIFPIDNWHHNKIIAKLQAIKSEILKRLLIYSIADEFNTKKVGIKRLVLHTMYLVAQKIGNDKLNKLIDKSISKSFNYNKKYIGCRVWTSHCTAEVLPASIFEKTEYLSFCDAKFPVPIGYKEYLDALYGDWQSELPPEKQCSNHTVKVWWKNEE